MIIPITDERQVEAAQALVAEAADHENWIKAEWARAQNFVVVALPGQEFSAIDVDALARAIEHLGVTELIAVLAPRFSPPSASEQWMAERMAERLPHAKKVPSLHLLSSTIDDIREYSSDMHHLEVLTDRQLRFLLFLTFEETSLIAGPRRFVEEALGKTIDAAWEEFESWAEHWAKSGWLGGRHITDYKWLAYL